MRDPSGVAFAYPLEGVLRACLCCVLLLHTQPARSHAMTDTAKAALILIFSLGLVVSYPALMYPPIRRGARKLMHWLGWPVRTVRRSYQNLRELPERWRTLRSEIERLSDLAAARETELTETAGRMWLETQLYTYKPSDLIRNADRNHASLAELHAELRARTFGKPVTQDEWFRQHDQAYRPPPLEEWWQVDLWFSWLVWKLLAAFFMIAYALPRRYPPYRLMTPRPLERLLGDWRSLTRRQALLRTSMEKIPEKTREYDQQQSAKELEQQQRAAEKALRRPLQTAEVALEVARGYIRRMQFRRRHAPTKGSAVLLLDQALQQWQVRIRQIERERAEGCTPREFIQAVHALERDMSLSGTYAVKVVKVERRAQQIQSLHKRLKRRWRDLRMPDDVLKTITTTIRRDVAGLWANSRWDALEAVLEETLRNIVIYESVILSRVWHLQAGTFDQLIDIVFQPEVAARDTEIRFSPDAGEPVRQAARGSSKISPFVERVQEHSNGDRTRSEHER